MDEAGAGTSTGSGFEAYASKTTPPFSQYTPPKGWSKNSIDPGATKSFSLVFVVDKENERLLLGLKKRGLGAGLYNGFGGKPLPGETIDTCAQRELQEESGLQIESEDLIPSGTIYISRPSYPSTSSPPLVVAIHIYICHQWYQDPIETEEMAPKWFDISANTALSLPFAQMWPEASLYLPPLISRALSGLESHLWGYVEYQSSTPGCLDAWRYPKTALPAADPPASQQQALAGWVLGFQ